MRNRLLALFGLVLVTSLGGAQRAGDKDDMTRLQGKWKCIGGNIAGMPLNEKEAAELDIALTIKADRLTKFTKGKSAESATFKLNITSTPKEIDTVPLQGTSKGLKSRGIFNIDSDGETLKWCYRDKLNGRPGKFHVPEGSDDVLLILRREIVIVYRRSLAARMLGYSVSPVIRAAMVELEKK